MERAESAREAVLLMGSLAEAWGFYGAGSFEVSVLSHKNPLSPYVTLPCFCVCVCVCVYVYHSYMYVYIYTSPAGSSYSEGTAESLIVSDPNEGWIFHILPDPTGTSAIWAAKVISLPANEPYLSPPTLTFIFYLTPPELRLSGLPERKSFS